MASESPPTPPPPSNKLGLGKSSSPSMRALNRINVDYARSIRELNELIVQESLIRHNFKCAKAAQQDVNSKMERAIEKKAEYASTRQIMRGVVRDEKAKKYACYSSSLDPRNLSGACAPGSVEHDAKVPAVIVINKVPQKSVAGTSNGEEEVMTKETSV